MLLASGNVTFSWQKFDKIKGPVPFLAALFTPPPHFLR